MLDCRFLFALSEDDKTILRVLAQQDQARSQSAWLRDTMRSEAQRRGLWPIGDAADGETETHTERADVAHG